MQVLYASERPPYPFFLGGAARAAHMLLRHLASLPGTRCEALGSKDYRVSSWSFPAVDEQATLGIFSADAEQAVLNCGYRVRLLPAFYDELAAEIANSRPDLVWAQLDGALPVLETAARLGVRGMYYVHDAEFDKAEMCKIAALDCHLIASSGFLAEKVLQTTGCRAEVVYPPAELYFNIQGDPNGWVTMINPHTVKGLDTFIEIARRRPKVRFLLQESWKLDSVARGDLEARLAQLPNVRFAERVAEMGDVYRQTRVVLAPSRWEEGFGMVALEAASCGIPVIASRRGGLPEAVGDGGLLIDDYKNVEKWLQALDQVLNDPGLYGLLSERARRHAASENFSVKALTERLARIVSGPPTRPNWLARQLFAGRRRARDWPLISTLVSRRT